MEQINLGIVVIKPKQPLVDWVNRTVPLSPPVTLEELTQDCAAILVPAGLDCREEVLEYLDRFKPELFEMKLADWNRNPSDWPTERTADAFDTWFDLEVHSMVYDLVSAPVTKGDQRVVDLTGTWIVVSSPDLDDDYLYMETTPYITLEQDGAMVNGEFQMGLISGSLNGHREGDRVLFSFDGMDEMDPVNGAGSIMMQDVRMIFCLMFHLGDEFTFECELAEDEVL